MAKTSVGGQAVMEGVMMRAPDGIALAVRKSDGTIKKEFTPYKSAAKKGSILGLPVIRGVVSFIESLKLGMDTTTRSAQLAGLEVDEEESRFEKWLVKVFGKSAEKVIMGVTIVFALILSVGLFVLLLWRGITIAARAPDRFGALLVVGFVVQVALQAVLNVAVVTNTIPNTGISLPFFSSGGTSLMMLLGEMGIVLSVSRGET